MRALAALLLLAAPASALAAWHAANPAVAAAARDPRIAAALTATERVDAAILARDAAAFGALFEPGAVVNSPSNNIATREMAIGRIRNGMIDYTSLERSIEYAATRGEHDVILMGEETYTPVRASQFAGQRLRRRTTELWSDATGTPRLVLRQATVISIAPLAPR